MTAKFAGSSSEWPKVHQKYQKGVILGKFPSIFQYLRYFQIFRGFHHREFRNKTIVVGHNVPKIPKIWDFWQISGRSSPPAIEISGNSGVFRLHALRTFFYNKSAGKSPAAHPNEGKLPKNTGKSVLCQKVVTFIGGRAHIYMCVFVCIYGRVRL